MLYMIVVSLAFAMGYVTDAILSDLSYGILGNGLVLALGGLAGIFLFDYALIKHYVAYRHAIPVTWFMCGLSGGVMSLLALTAVRAIARR
ncbi:MAG: hypothetical protein JNM13_00910 [Hyphomicrobiaceae bacterium]|nr:hypothetical protein [Hyphomicrobiaceae bacterium]